MDGFKSFKEAFHEVEACAETWTFSGNGASYTKKELLDLSSLYDESSKPDEDGWNYFVTFKTGEIGLLSTSDNEVEILFTPEKQ